MPVFHEKTKFPGSKSEGRKPPVEESGTQSQGEELPPPQPAMSRLCDHHLTGVPSQTGKGHQAGCMENLYTGGKDGEASFPVTGLFPMFKVLPPRD